MTTHSNARIEPYWFGRTEQEIRAAVEGRAEAWAAVPGYSRYEWSDKHGVRRKADRYPMKLGKRNKDGYVLLNVIRDDGKPVTVAVAPMVLLAHHPAFRGLSKFPDGLETRHNPVMGDKTFNAYPEGIWPGTKAENNGVDKPEQAAPQHECVSYAECGEMVHGPGGRCARHVRQLGEDAGELLRAGANLMAVVESYGYASPKWTWERARDYGGYTGTMAEALAQHPGMKQQAVLRLRFRRQLRLAATQRDARLSARGAVTQRDGDSA